MISGFINADYYSPFNLAVSSDGSRLYVVAQDADELMVVDAGNNKVLNRLEWAIIRTVLFLTLTIKGLM